MGNSEQLAAENQLLRDEVEAYRRRELADLREQLALATANVDHYRAEAQRNADLGRQIHTEAQVQIEKLKSRIQALEVLPNARVTPPAGRPE